MPFHIKKKLYTRKGIPYAHSMKNSTSFTYCPKNARAHARKYKAFRLCLGALIVLFLLLLPLIYQKNVNASSLTNGVSEISETKDENTQKTNASSPSEPAQVDKDKEAYTNFTKDRSQLFQSYEHDTVRTTGQTEGILVPPYMEKGLSSMSPALRTATAIVAGDIIGATSIYFDDLRNTLNKVGNKFYEHVLPALMPYQPNARYAYTSSNGTEITITSKIMSGDSAGNILNEWLTMAEIFELVENSKEVHPLTSLRVGRPFFISIDTVSKKLTRFEYEIDSADKLIIEFTGEAYTIFTEAIPYEFKLTYIEGTVQDNFFNSVLNSGGNANFAIQLADIFSYDIDFIREIQNGDTFSALVEKRYREGEFKGYGRIIGAQFINNANTHHAYLFYDANDSTKLTYFSEDGKALQKAFLRSPVHFTRVSSKYTMTRKHPILGITRPHQGIDYAAPRGTPVVAVGDGSVTRSAYTGGYGNLIVVRHTGGLESQYAHLSGYAKGIKRGAKVQQGQTIGFVGSTGLSTGPHLDFRIKKNGKFVNPDKIIIPSKPPISKAQEALFAETVEEVQAYMNTTKKISDFDTNTWLSGIRY